MINAFREAEATIENETLIDDETEIGIERDNENENHADTETETEGETPNFPHFCITCLAWLKHMGPPPPQIFRLQMFQNLALTTSFNCC